VGEDGVFAGGTAARKHPAPQFTEMIPSYDHCHANTSIFMIKFGQTYLDWPGIDLAVVTERKGSHDNDKESYPSTVCPTVARFGWLRRFGAR
jgi:hypothetical protein